MQCQERLDTFDEMLSALVTVLERKGIMTQDEWEKEIEQRLAKAKGIPRYRDLQFRKS